jgi:hypothetical protein
MRLDGAGNLLDESKQLIADSEARGMLFFFDPFILCQWLTPQLC